MEALSFIGLGRMGGAMAGRLAQHFTMRLYDINPANAEAVKGERVSVAPSVAEAVVPGGVLMTMLPDDAAVQAVVAGKQGTAARLGKGGLHINTSTNSPDLAKRLADLYRREGGIYLSAPVWGRPDRAGFGELACSLAGPAAGKRRAKPFLDALVGRVEDFGEDASLANVVKVLGNFLVSTAIEGLGEALAVAEKHGLSRHAVMEQLVTCLFDCGVYRVYGPLVAAQTSGKVGFTAELGRKDLSLVRQIAAEVNVPVPFQNIIENRLIATIAKGRGNEDWSALSWIAAEDAGLQRPV